MKTLKKKKQWPRPTTQSVNQTNNSKKKKKHPREGGGGHCGRYHYIYSSFPCEMAQLVDYNGTVCC